jgi:Dodecin
MRGITKFWVKDVQCQVENNKVTNVRVNGKLSFILE